MVFVLIIAAVIVSEMINTAIENVIDLVSPEFHPLAKIVMNITAGAVLFSLYCSSHHWLPDIHTPIYGVTMIMHEMN